MPEGSCKKLPHVPKIFVSFIALQLFLPFKCECDESQCNNLIIVY